jgi:hypothetical protein
MSLELAPGKVEERFVPQQLTVTLLCIASKGFALILLPKYSENLKIMSKGSACTYDNQCGRVSMCKYDSPTSIYGTCMPLFTIPDGGVLDGKLIYVNSSSANGFPLRNEFTHF